MRDWGAIIIISFFLLPYAYAGRARVAACPVEQLVGIQEFRGTKVHAIGKDDVGPMLGSSHAEVWEAKLNGQTVAAKVTGSDYKIPKRHGDIHDPSSPLLPIEEGKLLLDYDPPYGPKISGLVQMPDGRLGYAMEKIPADALHNRETPAELIKVCSLNPNIALSIAQQLHDRYQHFTNQGWIDGDDQYYVILTGPNSNPHVRVVFTDHSEFRLAGTVAGGAMNMDEVLWVNENALLNAARSMGPVANLPEIKALLKLGEPESPSLRIVRPPREEPMLVPARVR